MEPVPGVVTLICAAGANVTLPDACKLSWFTLVEVATRLALTVPVPLAAETKALSPARSVRFTVCGLTGEARTTGLLVEEPMSAPEPVPAVKAIAGANRVVVEAESL